MEMYELFKSLLLDEQGISEESFNRMYDYVDMLGNEFQSEEVLKLKKMLSVVDATDGRFYLPENFED